MKKIPKANYQTAEELDARVKAREAEAAVKRWLAVAPPSGK
jgi:hypothetical protein